VALDELGPPKLYHHQRLSLTYIRPSPSPNKHRWRLVVRSGCPHASGACCSIYVPLKPSRRPSHCWFLSRR